MENHGNEINNDISQSGSVTIPASAGIGSNVGGGPAETPVLTPGNYPNLLIGGGTNFTTTGMESPYYKKPNVFQRIYMRLTRSINESNYKHDSISYKLITYDDKYWAVIRANESGLVWFKVFRGWRGGQLLYRCGILRGLSLYWESVPQREKIEATLGAACLKVEETIRKDQKRRKQIAFIKETCKTDPDNLKMIAELDKLDKGIPTEETKVDMYAPQFTVSGSGTYSGS